MSGRTELFLSPDQTKFESLFVIHLILFYIFISNFFTLFCILFFYFILFTLFTVFYSLPKLNDFSHKIQQSRAVVCYTLNFLF